MKKQILQKNMCCMAPGMRGLSMVELMVAMTIGLILTASIGYVYLGSRQTFRSMDDFSRIQENYRYAMDQIGVDVRQAGYSGCVNVSSIDPAGAANPLSNPADPLGQALMQALRGYSDGKEWAAPAGNYVANTDVLRVTAGMGQGVNVTAATGSEADVNGNPAGIAVGDTLLISNCQKAAVVAAVAVAPTKIEADQLLSDFSLGAEIYPFVDTFYYIGTNPAGNRSLYRIQDGGAAEELVENVEDMVLRFGVDTNNDFAIDAYVVDPADVGATWRQVLSVRVNLVFLSNNNVGTGAQPCFVEGGDCSEADTRLRQVATATYGLRNRLP